MTSLQQRAELQRQIWAIANDVRGSVDGWDFKQYVLGTLFYRFISENFVNYITGGDESVNYAAMSDDDENIQFAKDDAIKTKGYFLYPSQLFSNVAANAHKNENLNTDLAAIFAAIENSANGYDSEKDIKGLFADFDTTSNRLGNTVEAKNKRLAAVLKGVAGLNITQFEDNENDLFGDAYEFLISNYAANAGKSGGEFFTLSTFQNSSRSWPCMAKPVSIKSMTLRRGRARCCYKLKSTLMHISLKMVFLAKSSTTPPITWRV